MRAIYHDLEYPVSKRKYNVDKDKLIRLLRKHKKEEGLTNLFISSELKRPVTEVDHWFRLDESSSIPDKDVWFELKNLLKLNTNEFDLPVTVFEEVKGVYEKAGRFYEVDGLSPTLTSVSAAENIIIREGYGKDMNVHIQEGNSYSSKFNYVSLFSGIGGFEQALNKLGGKCVLASEIDKFAAESYEAIYGVKPEGDITQIEASNVPEHDVLVGGFPCQSFSNAGLRRGFDDVRGTLFFEIARIAEEKQPKALLLENVKGLVNHDKGNTLNVMLRLLNNIGYVVDFDIMNSKYFGVPQNRERIFIVAIREDLIESEPFNGSATLGNTIIPKRKRDINNWDVAAKTFNFDFPEQSEVTTRLRDILESEVDEKYYLDDDKTSELVAQLEYGLAVNEATKQGYAVANEGDAVNFQFPNSKTRRGRIGKGIANTLEASSINQGVVEKGEIITLGMLNMKGRREIREVHDPSGINPTLTTMQGGHREPKIAEEIRPVITPNRPNKRQNGRRFKDNDDEAFTLTTQDRHGVTIEVLGNINPSGRGMNGQVYDINGGLSPTLTTNKGEGHKISKLPKYRIRKLTPLECWRLQSFTDEDFNKAKDKGISNSQLYKQAGNAVTVNVVYEVSKNLIKLIKE